MTMIHRDITYVGVNDHAVDLFEGQYTVPNGMSYNSYVVFDEKIAVFDTVDGKCGDVWFENLAAVLGDKRPDYLIVSHMEPDHSANIHAFAERYPEAVIVATDKAFAMMGLYFGTDYADRRLAVKDGDTLSLGSHELAFYTAPMVHWPEVMVTFDTTTGVLFSADAFGKFGALDIEEDWVDEARRYYIGIVGKYGAQVQALFKKVGALPINAICPLHGPVLTEDLGKYLSLYTAWASYEAECDGVCICYTSVYGNTKQAVTLLADTLTAGGKTVVVHDLARCDKAAAIADAFRFDKLVLATTTYNAGMFPFMEEFIHGLTERGFKNRTVGLIENGSWAPMAAKLMKGMLESAKGITFAEPVVTVRAALNDTSRTAVKALAAELA